MKLKLHAFPPSPRSFKVLVVANHLGIEHDLVICDLTKGEQRRPEYGAINPNHKAPALEHGDFKLWESNAMIQYLASLKPESGLLPRDEAARANVLQWMFWESTTWDSAAAILAFENFVKGFFGMGPPDPAEVEKGMQRFNSAATILDAHLKGRAFVCGDQMTLADFALGAALILEEPAKLPVSQYAEIKRWASQLKALPAWAAVEALRNAPAAAA